MHGNAAVFKPPDSVVGKVLKTTPDGRHLMFECGKPFFYLGDTAWTLFKRLDHDDLELYFRNRVAKGFNVVQAYLLRGLNVENLYGHVPLVGGDPAKPNNAFYENVDYAVNRANELGLVVGGVVCWGNHVQADPRKPEHAAEAVFDAANAYAHGTFLGRRYRGNCVVWFLGGDRKPRETRDVWVAMAKGLKDGSEDRHLVSYHGPGATGKLPSSSVWFHEEEWLDFNVLQTGHGWTVNNYDFVAHDRGLQPAKPVLDMESSYENHIDKREIARRRIDAHQVRESMYWQVLAGAAGHGYGCNDVWCFWDEKLCLDWRDYAFPSQLKQNTHWKVAMDFPGAVGVGLARKLFELRPWHKMAPDPAAVASGQGEGEDHVEAARAEDGSFVLAYLPFGHPVGIRMDRVSGAEVKAQWYNPRDGRFIPIGTYANVGVREFAPPTSYDADDWVLALEDEAKEYPCEIV